MKAASKDAMGAFMTFSTNPVGGLSEAYQGLGPARSLGVGITFGMVFALCILGATYRYLGDFLSGRRGRRVLQDSDLCRRAFRHPPRRDAPRCAWSSAGTGSFGSDSFLAGAALLPFAIVAIATILLGPANWNIISAWRSSRCASPS